LAEIEVTDSCLTDSGSAPVLELVREPGSLLLRERRAARAADRDLVPILNPLARWRQ
jgi:hypothetical protein